MALYTLTSLLYFGIAVNARPIYVYAFYYAGFLFFPNVLFKNGK